MTELLAVDSSVAVPLILASHARHDEVTSWWGRREGALCGPALMETYSVLTRLPAPMRLGPEDAARLLAARFATPLTLGAATSRRIPEILAKRRVAGGSVYDAVVALAAIEHDRVLATRDERARGTYEAVGAQVLIVA